ncbi:MAG: TolC family protein [Planctomycetia bacterium]|nr:TolC family protein [Planctomycetia bacterium]
MSRRKKGFFLHRAVVVLSVISSVASVGSSVFSTEFESAHVSSSSMSSALVQPSNTTQPPAAPQSSIAELEALALANHPAIQAYEQKIQALNGIWLQEGLGPNPEIEYSGEDMSSGSAGSQGIHFSQEIVTGGKLARAQDVVCHEIQTMKHAREVVVFRVKTDVRVAAFAYIAAQRKMALMQDIVKTNEQIYSLTKSLYESGSTNRLDLLNVSMEMEKSKRELTNLGSDLEAAWRNLACVVGDPNLSPAWLADSLDCTPQVDSWGYYQNILEQTSPEIARAQAQVAQAKKKLELECAKNSSNFTISGGVAYAAEEHRTEASVGVSIPLRIRDRNQGNIAAARSEIVAAQKDYERTLLEVRQRLADTYNNFKKAAEDVTHYRTYLLPQARESLELAQKGYQQGELTYLDWLNAQQNYTELNIAYLERMCDYWTFKSLLEGKLLSGGLEDSPL